MSPRPPGGGGGRFLLKIPEGGGGVSRSGRGAGRVSAANWGFWEQGGGAKYFFSGPKCPPSNCQRESNMHRIEVHHFASPFAPQFPGGGKKWIHTGDPVEVVRLPTEKGGFPVLQKGQFPLGKRGAKATQNGNHGLVYVRFSLKLFVQAKNRQKVSEHFFNAFRQCSHGRISRRRLSVTCKRGYSSRCALFFVADFCANMRLLASHFGRKNAQKHTKKRKNAQKRAIWHGHMQHPRLSYPPR